MKSISASDITLLHNAFKLEIENHPEFRQKSKRQLYFLAACAIFDSNLDLCVALKLRPHGGLIGIDDSSLDYCLKFSKVFRLHAVLHDAAGFVKEHSNQGPGYIYFLNFSAKELHSPDGDSTTAPPSQSSEQSEVKLNNINKVEFQLNPLQINNDCAQDPDVKKIKKVPK